MFLKPLGRKGRENGFIPSSGTLVWEVIYSRGEGPERCPQMPCGSIPEGAAVWEWSHLSTATLSLQLLQLNIWMTLSFCGPKVLRAGPAEDLEPCHHVCGSEPTRRSGGLPHWLLQLPPSSVRLFAHSLLFCLVFNLKSHCCPLACSLHESRTLPQSSLWHSHQARSGRGPQSTCALARILQGNGTHRINAPHGGMH